MTDPRSPVGVSACLLGEPVRYDGGHRRDRFLAEELADRVTFVALCPEVGCGLPVPREPMRLAGDPSSPRLVVARTGEDLTAKMLTWCRAAVHDLARRRIAGFVLKSRSPSCGLAAVPVFDERGEVCGRAPGIFARVLVERFPLLPVVEEEQLGEPARRQAFVGLLGRDRR